eukprot:461804_1
MLFSTIFVATISFAFSLSNDNIEMARYPEVQGTVVLQPGTNDINTCFSTDGYDGGGFWIQDQQGNGIWVCPSAGNLVTGINVGDKIRVTGLIESNKVRGLTIKANVIDVITSSGTSQEVVGAATATNFASFEYGDLVSYEGFAEIWWIEDVGVGFGITDCAGNTIKGWWTTQDDEVDVYDLFGFLKPGDDASSYSPSYVQMVGFKDIYLPYCASFGGDEFQPRPGDVTIITNPCI